MTITEYRVALDDPIRRLTSPLVGNAQKLNNEGQNIYEDINHMVKCG